MSYDAWVRKLTETRVPETTARIYATIHLITDGGRINPWDIFTREDPLTIDKVLARIPEDDTRGTIRRMFGRNPNQMRTDYVPDYEVFILNFLNQT